MAVLLAPFDVADYIDTPEAEAVLLADAIKSGDARYIAHAQEIVARARLKREAPTAPKP